MPSAWNAPPSVQRGLGDSPASSVWSPPLPQPSLHQHQSLFSKLTSSCICPDFSGPRGHGPDPSSALGPQCPAQGQTQVGYLVTTFAHFLCAPSSAPALTRAPPTSPTSPSPLSQRESWGSVRRLGRRPRLRKMVKSRPMRSAATPEYSSSPAERATVARLKPKAPGAGGPVELRGLWGSQ